MHTRLAHSLGVYHVGRMIMQRLVSTGAEGLDVTGIRSFLAACLLHDIGHFPYAHSLKELSVREHEELASHTPSRSSASGSTRSWPAS